MKKQVKKAEANYGKYQEGRTRGNKGSTRKEDGRHSDEAIGHERERETRENPE